MSAVCRPSGKAVAVDMAAVVDVAEVGIAAVRMSAAAVAKPKAAGAVSSRILSRIIRRSSSNMAEGAVAVAGAKAHPSSDSSSNRLTSRATVAGRSRSISQLSSRSSSSMATDEAAVGEVAAVGASNRVLDSRSRSRNLSLVAVPACRREAALRRAFSGQQGGAAILPHMAA